LRAESWREVAIICPVKRWFYPLRMAFRAAGLKAQLQSERDIKGDRPVYAWFTALVTIMAAPCDSFQIVGVLREVFGLSDHALAEFCEGYASRFHLTELGRRRGIVADVLLLLAEIRSRMLALPLFAGIEELIRATGLRDRLRSLPEDEVGDVDAELDALLTRAAAEEAAGVTLTEFAEDLRLDFHATREVQPAPDDAIQLITAHKAKGSEWQAVIVPGLGREIRPRSAR
jgi:ATP-dependent exoDNAse (exonuclease V) beta subunit